MVGQAERKILWHPRGENKFIVGGGSQLTLYEWSSEPSIVQLASQHDLSLMKVLPLLYMRLKVSIHILVLRVVSRQPH